MSFRNRLCLVTDIEAYSGHTISERADAERRLFAIQQFALARAGAFRVQPLPREDRGDGQLVLLPPTLDPTRAVPAMVAGFRHGLYLANSDPGAFGRLRIRVSLAQGAVSLRGPLGPRGDALIAACRLNDAEPLKRALRQNGSADLAFIVTDELYRDVVRHDFGSLPSAEFSEVKIGARGYDGTAWMYLPARGPVPGLGNGTAAAMWGSAAAGALVAGLTAYVVTHPHGPRPDDAADDHERALTDGTWVVGGHDHYGFPPAGLSGPGPQPPGNHGHGAHAPGPADPPLFPAGHPHNAWPHPGDPGADDGTSQGYSAQHDQSLNPGWSTGGDDGSGVYGLGAV